MSTRSRTSFFVTVAVALSTLAAVPAWGAETHTTRPAHIAQADPADPSDPSPTVIDPFAVGTTRLAGASRIDTAIAASKHYHPGVSAVFIATSTNFPDALSAAAASALVGGPLLLTDPASLPAAVLTEVKRLEPARIYVVGGAGAVSAKVFNALAAVKRPERLQGSDRYATGLAVVTATFQSATTAFIATGATFPDALAATGAAGASHSPVILVDGNKATVSSATLDLLGNLGVTDVAIAGGTGVVSSSIETQLRTSGRNVIRYGGGDRYSTAAVVNAAFFSPGTDTAFLATGTAFPDALAGAALAGRLGAPLYITQPACMPDVTRSALAALGNVKTVVMGGTGAVSAASAAGLGCLSGSTPTISGTVRVGSTLTAHVGSWTAGTSFSYRWYANGAAIGGTASTLTLSAAVQGKRISVHVTGSQTGYVSLTKSSGSTAVVAGKPTPPPAPPGNPGNTKNCSDFATWAQAQAWFLKYLPYYGDVAQLDADNDGIACETLPGAP